MRSRFILTFFIVFFPHVNSHWCECSDLRTFIFIHHTPKSKQDLPYKLYSFKCVLFIKRMKKFWCYLDLFWTKLQSKICRCCQWKFQSLSLLRQWKSSCSFTTHNVNVHISKHSSNIERFSTFFPCFKTTCHLWWSEISNGWIGDPENDWALISK